MDKMIAGYRPKYQIKNGGGQYIPGVIALVAVQAWRLKCKATKTKDSQIP